MRHKKDKLSRQINIHFTENEYNLLREKMEDAGYGSMAMFTRDIIRKGKIVVEKTTTKSRPIFDNDTKEVIKNLEFQYKGIARNYNQLIERVNTLMKMKTRDGFPVVKDEDAFVEIINILESKTDQLIETYSELKSTIEKAMHVKR